jgi:hypothetical protein
MTTSTPVDTTLWLCRQLKPGALFAAEPCPLSQVGAPIKEGGGGDGMRREADLAPRSRVAARQGALGFRFRWVFCAG